MTLFLLLAAMLADQSGGARRATPPPSPETVPRPPTDWPPFSMFSDDDYPAAALRAEEQGTTRFRIEINSIGRITSCTITQSSGSTSLDQATCRIVRNRTSFRPARDSRGRPVADRRDGEVTWRLPEE
jgi:protein TonB